MNANIAFCKWLWFQIQICRVFSCYQRQQASEKAWKISSNIFSNSYSTSILYIYAIHCSATINVCIDIFLIARQSLHYQILIDQFNDKIHWEFPTILSLYSVYFYNYEIFFFFLFCQLFLELIIALMPIQPSNRFPICCSDKWNVKLFQWYTQHWIKLCLKFEWIIDSYKNKRRKCISLDVSGNLSRLNVWCSDFVQRFFFSTFEMHGMIFPFDW